MFALLTAEAAMTAYVAFVTLVLGGWFMNDSTAFGMTVGDWVVAGLLRFGSAVVAAVASASVVWGTNALLLARLGAPLTWNRRITASVFGVIAVAGVAGSIYFVIERPFL